MTWSSGPLHYGNAVHVYGNNIFWTDFKMCYVAGHLSLSKLRIMCITHVKSNNTNAISDTDWN